MINWDDFDKIWARTSPLTPYQFSDSKYEQGWNFVGATPPSRQMWDYIQKQNDEKFKYLRDNFGTPNMVTSSSQMTDTEKVYVYMGSEAGWNSGHWYYYDEGTSSWADGGVYNSVAFVTDTTLSIAGQPADAKATGDALALKSDLAGCTFTGDVVVNANLSAEDSTFNNATVTDTLNATRVSASHVNVWDITSRYAYTDTPLQNDHSNRVATTKFVYDVVGTDKINIMQQDIANIKALLKGDMYTYQKDSSSNLTKTVPSNAMPYAGIESVGGKTIVWNQLVVTGNRTSVRNGITYTITSDGTVVINGTSTAIADFAPTVFSTDLTIGHVYWLRGCPADSSASTYYLNTNNGACYADGLRFTANSSTTRVVHIRVESGVTANNVTFKIQCTDLTLMFGAGNEPTLDECKAMFPAEYYESTAGEFLTIYPKWIRSRSKNLLYSNKSSDSGFGGLTWLMQDDGSIVLNGTPTYNAFIEFPALSTWKWDGVSPCWLSGCPSGGSSDTYALLVVGDYDEIHETMAYSKSDYGNGVALENNDEHSVLENRKLHYRIYVADGYTCNNLVFRPQLEYGTSATEFVPFFQKQILIDENVRNMDGYGWSVGTVHNTTDFEMKRTVKFVNSVDLGTLNWYSVDSGDVRYFYTDDLNTLIVPSTSNIATVSYMPNTWSNVTSGTTDKSIAVNTDGRLAVYDSTMQEETSASFKQLMDGKELRYEAKRGTIVDLSSYLDDNNTIQVSGGGRIVIESQDWKYNADMPSTIEYMIDLNA